MPLNFPNLYSDKKQMNAPGLHGNLPLMRGKVVFVNDPKKIGRVQVRIPSFHGVPGMTDRFIKDEDLPWAMPCFYGGCGQDLGSFIVPVPGTFVWLFFEDNDAEKPVYFGGVPGIGSELSKTVNNLGEDESPQQPWQTDAGKSDIPWDEFDGKSTGVPERPIIFKSQKGHTIMFDDTDEEESITIVDRIGQIIKFFCGITKSKNKEKYRRELKTAEKDEQLGFEASSDDPYIMLRSGETAGDKKLHSMIKMFKDHMRGECIDADNDKHTSTDYDPYEYNQETQTSILNMQENHIYFDFKDRLIHEEFNDDRYYLRAFDKCYIECTKDHMLFEFDGNGLYIDSQNAKLFFNDTSLVETDKDVKIKANDYFSMEAADSKIEGDKNLHGKGSDFKFEGSGSLETNGGKTFMKGQEIHFDK